MPLDWRKYFAYLGFTQECEEESPGYTVGLACFLIFMAVAAVWLAYGIFWQGWKIQ